MLIGKGTSKHSTFIAWPFVWPSMQLDRTPLVDGTDLLVAPYSKSLAAHLYVFIVFICQCISSIGQIIKSVCVCVCFSEWVSLSHKTSWTLYRSQSSSDVHQTCHQGRVPGVVVTDCFWWKIETFLSAKPEMELILTIAPMENIFNVKYLENGERYDVWLKGGRIGNVTNFRLALWNLTLDDLELSENTSSISKTLYRMQQNLFLAEPLFYHRGWSYPQATFTPVSLEPWKMELSAFVTFPENVWATKWHIYHKYIGNHKSKMVAGNWKWVADWHCFYGQNFKIISSSTITYRTWFQQLYPCFWGRGVQWR